jgi:hypothetical protein
LAVDPVNETDGENYCRQQGYEQHLDGGLAEARDRAAFNFLWSIFIRIVNVNLMHMI